MQPLRRGNRLPGLRKREPAGQQHRSKLELRRMRIASLLRDVWRKQRGGKWLLRFRRIQDRGCERIRFRRQRPIRFQDHRHRRP